MLKSEICPRVCLCVCVIFHRLNVVLLSVSSSEQCYLKKGMRAVGGRSKNKNRGFVSICQSDCLQCGHADKSEPVGDREDTETLTVFTAAVILRP